MYSDLGRNNFSTYHSYTAVIGLKDNFVRKLTDNHNKVKCFRTQPRTVSNYVPFLKSKGWNQDLANLCETFVQTSQSFAKFGLSEIWRPACFEITSSTFAWRKLFLNRLLPCKNSSKASMLQMVSDNQLKFTGLHAENF